MDGQGIERREVLRVMALAATGSGFPGVQPLGLRLRHQGPGPGVERPTAYQPQFFSRSEYATIERLTEMVIRSGLIPAPRRCTPNRFAKSHPGNRQPPRPARL